MGPLCLGDSNVPWGNAEDWAFHLPTWQGNQSCLVEDRTESTSSLVLAERLRHARIRRCKPESACAAHVSQIAFEIVSGMCSAAVLEVSNSVISGFGVGSDNILMLLKLCGCSVLQAPVVSRSVSMSCAGFDSRGLHHFIISHIGTESVKSRTD